MGTDAVYVPKYLEWSATGRHQNIILRLFDSAEAGGDPSLLETIRWHVAAAVHSAEGGRESCSARPTTRPIWTTTPPTAPAQG